MAVITGTRADYGLLVSTLRALRAEPSVRLQLVVTGMHLLTKFGHTVDEVRADGWRIAAEIPMQRGDDSPSDQAEGLSAGVRGIARFLLRAKSDLVVVLGDRIEAMAGALAGVLTGCAVAHIHGGDVAPGDFDDALRHSITKLAHLHFPATRAAAARLRRMGESADRIQVVGAPGLDDCREAMEEARGTDSPPDSLLKVEDGFVVVVQHPCGRSADTERRVMETILEAVRLAGRRAVVVHPNSDRGHSGILRAVSAHRRRFRSHPVTEFPSLPRGSFLELLRCCNALVGNSSCGVIEAPFLGVPVVNVGPRQSGRERGGRGIVDAEETAASISRALGSALGLRLTPGRPTPYGDGRAGERIARTLSSVSLETLHRPKPAP